MSASNGADKRGATPFDFMIVVATNGVWDLVHRGHCQFLQQAKAMAGYGGVLVVGVNSDASVRQLGKGPERPINSEFDRLFVIKSLACVNHAVIFNGVRATEFLKEWRPQIYVKANSYSLETLDADERRVLEGMGTEIRFLPMTEGLSTTAILEKINRL